MRTAIWLHLDDEMPPRHLPGIGPASQVSEAEAAIPEAFGLQGAVSVELSYADVPLTEKDKSLAEYGVPSEALLRGRLTSEAAG
jgi:hypothetical protein